MSAKCILCLFFLISVCYTGIKVYLKHFHHRLNGYQLHKVSTYINSTCKLIYIPNQLCVLYTLYIQYPVYTISNDLVKDVVCRQIVSYCSPGRHSSAQTDQTNFLLGFTPDAHIIRRSVRQQQYLNIGMPQQGPYV